MSDDLAELVLNRTWRPAVGLSAWTACRRSGSAGNVLRPFTAAKLSIRLPPITDAETAAGGG